MTNAKSETAFRTIGELATEIGLPQHILRYWETRFPQLRPVTRAGNRRYYRPEDVALVRRIDQALNRDGYTVKGVQKLLSATGHAPDLPHTTHEDDDILAALLDVRRHLVAVLADDRP